MRLVFIWVREFIKLLGGRRLYPLTTQCPVCQRKVRLHVNKAGRQHVYAHARALYEGAWLSAHEAGEMRCVGSGTVKAFDPRPNEHQRFKLPGSLLEE